MSEPLDLEAIKARKEAAYDELIRVCSVGEVTRMSIPANPARDTDLLISAVFKDTDALVAEVERLRDENAELRGGTDDDEWEHSFKSGIPIRRRLSGMTPGPWELSPSGSQTEGADRG